MSESNGSSTGPVTAADVEHAVRSAVTALRAALGANWRVPAASSEWECWETVEHLGDGLFSYAAQLAPETPPSDGFVPFVWTRQKPDGPANVLFADRGAGPAGLLQILEVGGALLVAMVRTVSPRTRAFHAQGVADPEGFAAMGVVETLVHTHDVAEALGVPWAPPADLCDRVLARLFPDAPTDTDRWPTLLWATGRAELPGRPRLTSWRWYSAPRG